MTIPSLVYTEGTVRKLAPITAVDQVTLDYNPSTGVLDISENGAFTSGQQIFSGTYFLDTDFAPTVIVPPNGLSSSYGYNPLASFWSISYTPLATSSSVIVSTYIPTLMTASVTASAGVAVFAYKSNTTGALPLTGMPAVFEQPLYTNVANSTNSPAGIAFIANSTGDPITIYFCAFAMGSVSGQTILSTTSTATVYEGYTPATAQLIEVAS